MAKKDILNSWPKGIGLIFVDCKEEPRECDFCDEKKPLASIQCLCKDVMCICQECLQTFANAFDE